MMHIFLRRSLACAALALMGTGALAATYNDDDETPWQEDAPTAAPAFSTGSLVKIDMGVNSALRYGIDPATLSIGKDDVVRYVMVATSNSGAQNVWYQGIQCKQGAVKTYARWSLASSDSPAHWYMVENAEWRSLFDGSALARPALVMAREGLCDGPSPNRPISKMLRDLQQGVRIESYR